MRLAVFTAQFPGKVNTFFARDLRALLDEGLEIDVFPIYPLQASLWKLVPPLLDEKVLPRNRVHHISPTRGLVSLGPAAARRALGDALVIGRAARPAGLMTWLKSLYVVPKAWWWARRYAGCFDHVLAYWGNYCATCAYAFHRLVADGTPFSLLLHAGVDLYGRQAFLREKLLYADRIFVVCDFNRAYLQEHYAEIYEQIAPKIHVHHLGLDLARPAGQPDARREGRVVAVGRFVRNKGFDKLLRAVGELRRKQCDVDLELIGEGPEGDNLRRLASELQIEDAVNFRGWLAWPEVQQAMGRATLLVHPSSDEGDAVPTVIKEALSVGTPVIASRLAGIPELLDDGRCGVLVPPGDVPGLQRALETLLQDPAKRSQLAEAGDRFAREKFDMWRNGARLATILRQTSPRRAPDEGPLQRRALGSTT